MAKVYITDVIEVYRRILKASKRGTGTRLTHAEVMAIACDGAVRQAIETADDEKGRQVA